MLNKNDKVQNKENGRKTNPMIRLLMMWFLMLAGSMLILPMLGGCDKVSQYLNTNGMSTNEELLQAYSTITQAQQEFYDYINQRFYSGTNHLLNIGSNEDYILTHLGNFDMVLNQSNIISYTNIILCITGEYKDIYINTNYYYSGNTNLNIEYVYNTNSYSNISNYTFRIAVTNSFEEIAMMGPNELLDYFAWKMDITKTTNEFFSYLKRNNLESKFWEIYNKYNIEKRLDEIYKYAFSNAQMIESVPKIANYRGTSRKPRWVTNYEWRVDKKNEIDYFFKQKFIDGDILLQWGNIGGSAASFDGISKMIKGTWKHAGLVIGQRFSDGKAYCVASGGMNSKALNGGSLNITDDRALSMPILGKTGIGYESTTNWVNIREYVCLRVKNSTQPQRTAVLAYHQDKADKKTPFNFVEKRRDTRYKYTTVKNIIVLEKRWIFWPFWYEILKAKTNITYNVQVTSDRSYLLPVWKYSDDLFYCSLIVWRAWYAASGGKINIEQKNSRTSDYVPGDKDEAGRLQFISGMWLPLDSGYGNYEWVTPQNIFDATKDDTLTNICYRKSAILVKYISFE